MAEPASTRTLVGCSPEPRYAAKAPRRDTSWSRLGRTVSDASSRAVGRQRPGSTTASPRATSPCSTPARFSATRCPGPIRSIACPWLWMARILAGRCAGPTTTGAPTASLPPVSVPVTTVPLPFAAKTRSTQSRGRPRSAAAGVRETRSSSAARSESSPEPRRGADRHHRRVGQERVRHVVGHVQGGQRQPLVVDRVGLGQRDECRGRCRGAPGSAGAPRSAASNPRWPPPRTGRRRPRQLRPACC